MGESPKLTLAITPPIFNVTKINRSISNASNVSLFFCQLPLCHTCVDMHLHCVVGLHVKTVVKCINFRTLNVRVRVVFAVTHCC